MGKDSKIEWTDHTWNPWYGCHKVSAGCKFCYAERDMTRYGRKFKTVQLASDKTFHFPYSINEPARIFTCSWSDFFIEEADEWRDAVWNIIKTTPHLTYQILTKRPENIPLRLPEDWGKGYPNVWLGISAENQEYLDHRLGLLLTTPARVRFLSLEPLLSLIEIFPTSLLRLIPYAPKELHWIITGGESGTGNKWRRSEIYWFRYLRVQAEYHRIPFFFKQHGGNKKIDGSWGGRELDGKYYNEIPSWTGMTKEAV